MANRPPVRPDNLDSLPLSRRQLLFGAGGVVLSQERWRAAAAAAAPPRAAPPPAAAALPSRAARSASASPAAAKDIIDGQKIVTKPDQARLVAGWETLLTTTASTSCTTDGLAEEVDAGQARPVHDQARDGHRVPQRQDARRADDVIYSIKRILDPGAACSAAPACLDRPQADQKIDNRPSA